VSHIAHGEASGGPLAHTHTHTRFGNLVASSAPMRYLLALAARVAPTEATLLIEGETGTGKTALARAIHEASGRSGRFVVVDCAAIPPALMESELFGHERGAFTGAVTSRRGALIEASGGTLLLDEVGELPQDLQPKLLRAIEERVVKPVGSQTQVPVDLRIISATNRTLSHEVERGLFRADLYFRLHVIPLRMPPLRDRGDDIPVLANRFYRELNDDPTGMLPPAVLRLFLEHDWPGNVRELRNAVERAAIIGEVELASDPAVLEQLLDLQPGPAQDPDWAPVFQHGLRYAEAKDRVVAAWERAYVAELLRWAGGNISRAARAADMNRAHLRRVMRRNDLTVDDALRDR
jgi:transcriptional regulator with GAF, ATPase, and Fis domain